MRLSVLFHSPRLRWVLLATAIVLVIPVARFAMSGAIRGNAIDIALSPVMLLCDKSDGCEHLCDRLATTVGLRNQWLNLRLVHSIKVINDTVRQAWEERNIVIETREFDLREFDLVEVPIFEDVDAERHP